MTTTSNIEMLRRDEVEAITGLARSTLYGLVKQKKFPAPVAITGSGRAVAWVRGEVEAYLQSCITAARTPSREAIAADNPPANKAPPR